MRATKRFPGLEPREKITITMEEFRAMSGSVCVGMYRRYVIM